MFALLLSLVFAADDAKKTGQPVNRSEEQVARVLTPGTAAFTVNSKPAMLAASTEYFTAVARDDKDKANLANLTKDGKVPSELIATEAGGVYAIPRGQLKKPDELRQAAKDGKLPPIYQGYKYEDALVFLDGNLIVKLTDVGQAGAFTDYCKKHKLTATPRKEEKALYTVSFANDSDFAEPFDAAGDLRKMAFVDFAEPVFIVQIKETDKPGNAKPKK